MSTRRIKSLNILPGKVFSLCSMVILLMGCTDTEFQDLRDFVAATKASSPGKKLEPLPQVEPYRPFIYAAHGLKDPFALAEFAKKAKPSEIDNGIRPDPNRRREPLEKYALGSLVMVGTIQRDGLWGLVKAPDGTLHRVQEGNYVGTDYGKVTDITRQRIEVKEIISSSGIGWTERNNFLSLAE